MRGCIGASSDGISLSLVWSICRFTEFATPDMIKERYEALTDKEKVEWLGIAECNVQDAIQRFISKLDSIDIVYRYSDDMLDEFMRLESVVAQMKREQCIGKGERSR